MADPQYQEFRGRLRRVERIHRRGGGFEAAGTLGRTAYVVKPQRTSLLRPVALVLGAGLLLKAVLLVQIGAADYSDRVARLQGGTQIEAIGAYIMQPDAVTVWLAGLLTDLVKSTG